MKNKIFDTFKIYYDGIWDTLNREHVNQLRKIPEYKGSNTPLIIKKSNGKNVTGLVKDFKGDYPMTEKGPLDVWIALDVTLDVSGESVFVTYRDIKSVEQKQ